MLSQLEAATLAPDGSPVIIVVDGAERLFHSHDHTMTDEELADALKVIASGRPRQVKVILVVQESPGAGSGSAWHGAAQCIYVGGLHRADFEVLLEKLDPAFEFGLANRTTAELDELYNALQGNPRLAELFCAVLGLPESRRRPIALMRQLEQKDPGEREGLLAWELVGSMSGDQRSVVAALAAFGTQVTIEQIHKLLDGKPSADRAGVLLPERIGVLLPELVNWHVISETPDQHYYLPTPAIGDALLRSKELSSDLLWDAMEVVDLYRMPEERVQKPEDLHWDFAKLDILIRAGILVGAGKLESSQNWWEIAYEVTNEIDKTLRRLKAAGMLLKYREVSEGNLKDPDMEMVNSNALGCIYMSRGRFPDAHRAFDDALQHANDAKSPEGQRKILINLATLFWNCGETGTAGDCYIKAIEDYDVKALAEGLDDGGALDLVAAEAGLADCYRRWGRYREAIGHGGRALSAARDQESPWAVGIAVKLARWHSELGQRKKAHRMMKVAHRAAAGYTDPALRRACLAGHADLLLDAGHFRMARHVAKRALNKAAESDDPGTVLRARTTLAMAHLELDDTAAAREEIGRAARCRREGSSLDVLALQALIAFRSGQDEEAREYFDDLIREAGHRQRQDPGERDFEAWDFEGLARCGLAICCAQDDLADALTPATAAFEHAGKHARAPGLGARLKRWLKILEKKAKTGQMDVVLAAIDKTTARPGPS